MIEIFIQIDESILQSEDAHPKITTHFVSAFRFSLRISQPD